MQPQNRFAKLSHPALVLAVGLLSALALTSGCGSGRPYLEQLTVSPGVSSVALGLSARFIAEARIAGKGTRTSNDGWSRGIRGGRFYSQPCSHRGEF